MMKRLVTLALGATVLLASGCISWSTNTETEDIVYAEFLEEGEGKAVAVAAFAVDTGLERDRWGRRKVFMAVSGSLLGLVPYPWDLRLVWSPPPIEKKSSLDGAVYDEDLTAALAERIEEQGFKAKPIPEGEDGTDIKKLIESAKEMDCEALYVVTYNEFTKLRFRERIRRFQGFLIHRVKTLTGSCIIPSVAMFMVKDGKRVMARSNTGRRGQTLRRNFYQALATYGQSSPLDGGARSVARFINRVSGIDIEDAREVAAEFMADRDFTPKPLLEGEDEEDEEEEEEEEEPSDEEPGEEDPSDEEPGEETPSDEEPGEETPSDEE
ncbi:MAG: hypothetical protein ACYTFG_08710, partial [Planctomycetota bacterium]